MKICHFFHFFCCFFGCFFFVVFFCCFFLFFFFVIISPIIRDKQATNSGSGPEFFGYSNPTILNLLQKMPDAKKCSKYKFVRFAEPCRRGVGGGRRVASGGGGDMKKANFKPKAAMKKIKKISPAKKTVSTKPIYLTGSKGPSSSISSTTITPVGMKGPEVLYDAMNSSDSSSSDLSSATDTELVIDS